VTERRFARLRRGAGPDHPGTLDLPNDGMCLSTFLVVQPEGQAGRVLMGRLDPTADWATIGGLDPARLGQIARRWMLPSSQLLFFESPTESAARIAKEQLGLALPGLTGPRTFSEAYARPGAAGDPHWDLHFVFEGRWPSPRFPRAKPFAELEFVDVARTPRAEIARSQADVLALVGLATAP
jgi:hypothetical protein